eukprot:TRINITY_DN56803_c0_g1_i1.p1 TRINITY_DN56803_c0_g1~~TRINITY_DN56803_c0_g1_i1.p1  ORF type:complete len:268 (-),score=70.69 TRINITY_DN56803_c0_g1_i1:104-907(-)
MPLLPPAPPLAASDDQGDADFMRAIMAREEEEKAALFADGGPPLKAMRLDSGRDGGVAGAVAEVEAAAAAARATIAVQVCADCGRASSEGAVDEGNSQWYCKLCWEQALVELQALPSARPGELVAPAALTKSGAPGPGPRVVIPPGGGGGVPGVPALAKAPGVPPPPPAGLPGGTPDATASAQAEAEARTSRWGQVFSAMLQAGIEDRASEYAQYLGKLQEVTKECLKRYTEAVAMEEKLLTTASQEAQQAQLARSAALQAPGVVLS